jgi:hypothetical protein
MLFIFGDPGGLYILCYQKMTIQNLIKLIRIDRKIKINLQNQINKIT